MSMQHRVVVVCGASGKLGPVVAHAFADSGARVAALARRMEEVEPLIASLPGGPARHLAVAADLGKPPTLKAAADTIRERLGPAEVLLQLVGGYRGELGLADAPYAELAAMLNVNLLSTYHAVRAFLPDIRAAEHGRIVTVSTPFAQNPGAASAGYAASKAAVETLTLSVAKELAGTTATANVIVIRTIGEAKPTHTRPEEIVAAILWLCSPAAGAINGQRIPLVGRA
jgi:NAD(P)-dependent dehydrogenase (short-subunit alcohol dehydrogenase family)